MPLISSEAVQHWRTRTTQVCQLYAGAAGPTASSQAPGCGAGSVGGGRNLLVQPYWSDTVWVPAGARVVTRIRFDAFPGRSVFHCHILPHEDLGMMGIYDVVEQNATVTAR